jgi:hypothetical protein
MVTDRFTWVGLGLVLLGWAALIADMTISESVLRSGNLVAVISLRSDIVTVAQTAILSGFGLALIGALRSGFGALNRFFEAVLQRSSTPRPSPVVDSAGPQVESPATHNVERMASSGRIKDRNYVILPDGSVEVDTLLGTRVFASHAEARDFIR